MINLNEGFESFPADSELPQKKTWGNIHHLMNREIEEFAKKTADMIVGLEIDGEYPSSQLHFAYDKTKAGADAMVSIHGFIYNEMPPWWELLEGVTECDYTRWPFDHYGYFKDGQEVMANPYGNARTILPAVLLWCWENQAELLHFSEVSPYAPNACCFIVQVPALQDL